MKRITILLALLLLPLTVHAKTYTCTGPVDSIGLHPQGLVQFSGAGGILNAYLCQIGVYQNGVRVAMNGINTEQCNAIYATLLAAKLSGKAVSITFNDSLTCTTHASWANLTWAGGPGF